MKSLAALAALCTLTVIGSGQTTLEEFQNMLKSNPKSSQAHYGIGDIYFHERSYQAAANEFRSALTGDLQPKWTKVWSHINLGKIFDIVGQRERAIHEYDLAIQTHDDTNGAQDEAAKYLKSPYPRP